MFWTASFALTADAGALTGAVDGAGRRCGHEGRAREAEPGAGEDSKDVDHLLCSEQAPNAVPAAWTRGATCR